MPNIVKIRTEELGAENPFLGVISIVDHESDLENLIFICRYHKNGLKRQIGGSSIPTSDFAENLLVGRC